MSLLSSLPLLHPPPSSRPPTHPSHSLPAPPPRPLSFSRSPVRPSPTHPDPFSLSLAFSLPTSPPPSLRPFVLPPSLRPPSVPPSSLRPSLPLPSVPSPLLPSRAISPCHLFLPPSLTLTHSLSFLTLDTDTAHTCTTGAALGGSSWPTRGVHLIASRHKVLRPC